MDSIFILYIKGILMGIADIIPGVSGGTIALITGIYERLVKSISQIDFRFIYYLLGMDFKSAKENFMKIDFQLFIPLFLGISTSFLVMANFIHYMIKYYPSITYSFFFGLITASSLLLYRKISEFSVENIIYTVIGFISGFIITGITIYSIGHSLPVIFFSGIVAICAMILPGISGAFILVILNQYEYMISVLKGLQIGVIVVFLTGATIGLTAFSRILRYMLENHRAAMLSFLIGLMIGALRLPYLNIIRYGYSLSYSVLSCIAGLGVVFLLERYEQ